jgi:hypothetical protein
MVLANLIRVGSGIDTENSLYPWKSCSARIDELGRPETGEVLKCARVSYEGNLVSLLRLIPEPPHLFLPFSRNPVLGITRK